MTPSKLCVVKMSSLGDILQVAYVVRHLKEHRQDLSITWIVEKKFQDLVSALDVSDNIIPFDGSSLKKNPLAAFKEILCIYDLLKKSSFDQVIDFQGNCKSALITLLCSSKSKVGFDKNSVAEFPNLFVTNCKASIDKKSPIIQQYYVLAKRAFPDLPPLVSKAKKKLYDKNTVMVCFGSNWENKRLSYDQLKSFLKEIHISYGTKFRMVVGCKKDLAEAKALQKELSASVEIFEKPSWVHWMELMQKVDLVISADSCALHLAGFLQVPTFSYFGPSSQSIYKPLGHVHISIQGQCPYQEVFAKRCKKLRSCPTGSCIKGITNKSLLDKFGGMNSFNQK